VLATKTIRTICYTGDFNDPARSKYDLKYYTDMARNLQKAGVHILGLKDMAGILKPTAAAPLIKALKEETGLPVHFHTHDTSGAAAATVLNAVEGGADIVDLAMDAFSGGTSQPCLGSVVAALRHMPKDTKLDIDHVRQMSDYWGAVRQQYFAFESGTDAPASEVYLHEMPGGQFTNLKAQAKSIGLEDRWEDVARTYADVNQMFGDIVKVTPSSKVVGDMALMMATQGLTRKEVEDPEVDVAFPASVVEMMGGMLGQPPGGWPEALQKKVLKGEKPITTRPGASLEPVDLEAMRKTLSDELQGYVVDDEDLSAYLMYPKVFLDYMGRHRTYGPVRVLPTNVFFFGMEAGDQISVEIDPGKTLEIRLLDIGDARDDGDVRVFFELNGQPRTIRVPDRSIVATTARRPIADPDNPDHVAAPMPGVVAKISATAGQKVVKGDLLLTIEAMKMETGIHAERDGVVGTLHASAGMQVDAKELLLVFEG